MMKKMRLLISIILMGLSCSAYSMNPDMVTVECSDGKELSVPRDVAKKVGMLNTWLERWNNENNNEDTTISLNQPDDASVKLDSQTLQELFNCVQNPSQIKAIKDIHKLEDFLAAGNYLDIAEEIRKDVAFRILARCDDFGELSETTQLIICNICTLVRNNELNLSKKGLRSLRNIECIVSPEDRHAITAIDCHGNQIKKLDIKKLKQIFPNLTHLNAQGNCINDVHIGIIGQHGLIIDLSGNCLSGQEVNKIIERIDSMYYEEQKKELYEELFFAFNPNLTPGIALITCAAPMFLGSTGRGAAKDGIFVMIYWMFAQISLDMLNRILAFDTRRSLKSAMQGLQRTRNSLNTKYQISPERRQRIRDRLMAVGKKLYEGEVNKVYGNDGLKFFTSPAVNNLSVITRGTC